MIYPDGGIIIRYNVEKDIFEIKSDMTREGVIEIIEAFVRSQLGAGQDDSKVEKKPIYKIVLSWYAEEDDIRVSSDTGNKGLREGILFKALQLLQADEIKIASF